MVAKGKVSERIQAFNIDEIPAPHKHFNGLVKNANFIMKSVSNIGGMPDKAKAKAN